jgi:hypothetical protein
METPKEKGGQVETALEESAPNLANIICHWQDHLGWIMRRYYRTGNAKDLQAAAVQKRAMVQNLSGRKRKARFVNKKGGRR